MFENAVNMLLKIPDPPNKWNSGQIIKANYCPFCGMGSAKARKGVVEIIMSGL